MMSAEHNRLMEAWIAGTLAEGEKLQLLRLAETDVELAQLLDEQAALEQGISADRAGLQSRYNGDALRTHVAQLSMRTEPKSVPVEQARAVKERSRVRSAGKWVVGLLLIGGATAGLYLVDGDNDTAGIPVSGETTLSPVETVLPSDASVSPSVPKSGADHTGSTLKEEGPDGNTAASGRSTSTPRATPHSGSATGLAATPADNSAPTGTTSATNPPPLKPDNGIEVKGEIEGNLPP